MSCGEPKAAEGKKLRVNFSLLKEFAEMIRAAGRSWLNIFAKYMQEIT